MAKKSEFKLHGTTHEIPLERLKEENLILLDQVAPYKVVRIEIKKVPSDCYISYLGNKYSVPYKFAGRTAELHIYDGKFQVYVDNEHICEHEILSENCRVIRKKNIFRDS